MVVEDEAAIADLILMNLKLVGYTGISASNGNDVMDHIEQHKPDLIILDVMLPGKDGFSLMKEIEPLQIPVIFLTAKEELNDKITGLKLGADDYMVRPFATIELLTRIETVLKRYRAGGTRTVDVHIQRLRKKLGLDDKIKTVFKVGYRLEVPR